MRHVAQHPRDDPQRRHRAACGRISQNAAIACASRTADRTRGHPPPRPSPRKGHRSEEHTSELQSLMRISYAVFCLKKKTKKTTNKQEHKSTKQINTKHESQYRQHTRE